MNLMKRSALMLCLATASAVLGCSGAGDAPVDPIPTDLAAVESAAEAGFDAALAGDRTAIDAAGMAIASLWASYRQRAPRDGVPANSLGAVDAAIADAARLSTANTTGPALARAFNAICAPMARIYAVYHPPVPADLLDLDHLGRELIVDARAADLARASADLDRLVAPASRPGSGACCAAALMGKRTAARRFLIPAGGRMTQVVGLGALSRSGIRLPHREKSRCCAAAKFPIVASRLSHSEIDWLTR